MPDSQAAVAQTTFEQFRPAVAAGRPWKKVGMCFGSLAVVAAVSLMALQEKRVPPREATAFDLAPETGTPQTVMVEAPEPAAPVQDIAAVLPEPSPETPPPDFGPPHVEAAIELRKGDTVARVLDRLGISATDGAEIVAALARHVRLDRLPIGQTLILKLQRLEAEEATVLVGLSITSSATTTGIIAWRRKSSR